MHLSHLSDQELLSHTGRLVGSHRELTAKLVAYLAEVEERRLHLVVGYPSMFEYCVRELGFSEGEAFRRILAARLGRRFPVIFSRLASGAVHLSALELVRDWLTDENHAALLDGISGKSKREIETILAARFPRADAPSRIFRDSLEALSEARFKVQFTATAELREKLELCRDLMSHANPNRDLGVVIQRAVDLLLIDLKRKRLGHANRPRRSPAVRPAVAGRITRAVRRAVFERDGSRCTYVSPDGRRCDARAFLELDHAQPRGRGGADDTGNLRVRCRAHNQLFAEQSYGREHIDRARRFRQKKCVAVCEERPDGENHHVMKASAVFERVRFALKSLGFRETQAQRAVADVERMHERTPTLEDALRAALLLATAKVG